MPVLTSTLTPLCQESHDAVQWKSYKNAFALSGEHNSQFARATLAKPAHGQEVVVVANQMVAAAHAHHEA